MQKFDTVDDYIESQPQKNKELLTILRSTIHGLSDNVIETMGYGVPTFSIKEKAKMEERIMIGGFKKHIGFYPHPVAIEHFKDKLKDYDVGKGTIKFPLDNELPLELIKEITLFNFNYLKSMDE